MTRKGKAAARPEGSGRPDRRLQIRKNMRRGRRDEKATLDLAAGCPFCQKGRGMRGGEYAETMATRMTGRAARATSSTMRPRRHQARAFPNHLERRGAQPGFWLPSGSANGPARTRRAGNDENVGVGAAHLEALMV